MAAPAPIELADSLSISSDVQEVEDTSGKTRFNFLDEGTHAVMAVKGVNSKG